MLKVTQGLHEARTRVTFFLPVNDAQELKAVLEVIWYIKTQRKRQVAVTGFTHSQFPETIFSGYWWDNEKWDRDRVVLFIIDYQRHSDDPQLERALGRLRQEIAQCYEKYDREQKEVWLIVQRATRYT